MATSSDADLSNLSVSLADLNDLMMGYDTTSPTEQLNTEGNTASSQNGRTTLQDKYYRPGTFLTADMLKEYAQAIQESAAVSAGAGMPANILQNFVSRMDRYGTALHPMNMLNYGYTFITRPRLNMTQQNLRSNAILDTLYSTEPNSIPFMIRALLDTRMARGLPIFNGGSPSVSLDKECLNFHNLCLQSGLLDVRNPFLVPLCNGLTGISGFPDLSINTEAYGEDLHSGDFTYANGSDFNNRTQELSLKFDDVQGSIVLSILYYWIMMIALQAKGIAMAYPDDIYEQRLNYTVAIYRFVTDTSRRHILWWAKATGCFPKSVPIGAIFDVSREEVTLSSAKEFSIPFVANDVKVNDPGILFDFKILMKRYCKDIDSEKWYDIDNPPETNTQAMNNVQFHDSYAHSVGARNNFMSLPWIENDPDYGINLTWRTCDEYYRDQEEDSEEHLEKMESDIVKQQQENIRKYIQSIRSQQPGVTNSYRSRSSRENRFL